MKFPDLWRWDGPVSRAAYATVGLVGVAIKHNLDRLIASSFLGYKNSFNYWAPLGKAARLDHLSDTETKFLATLLLVSIPFIWVGVAMGDVTSCTPATLVFMLVGPKEAPSLLRQKDATNSAFGSSEGYAQTSFAHGRRRP